ncbi:MAG: glycosyltransferase family 4 protein [Planctomycetota bacterium]|nr:glycosyltransferase family 4 protein [Planctomycetota bacterium]
MTQAQEQSGTAPERTRSRIAWLVPRPLEGSGGHRTILQNIDALEAAGHECHVFVEDPKPASNEECLDEAERLTLVREQLGEFFGFEGERLHLGFDIPDGFDLAIATAWYTAAFVARPKIKCRKAYFVQDYEAYFMPVNDGYLRAEDSYNLGLPVVSIGRWLTQRLTRENGCPATFFEFCADGNIYRPDPAVERERAVCAIYQPEKPRRCPHLLIQTLGTLKKHKPDVKIYLYGTREKPDLPFEHEHLGLVSVEACAALYNRCSAGLCISATNPSRIPFEMMACGLPVVDIHRPNNLFDMPENGVLLAQPRPDSLARALAMILDDESRWSAMSVFAREFMRPRTLEFGYQQFVSAVEDLLAGRERSWKVNALGLEPMYRRSSQLAFAKDPLTGAPVGKATTLAAGAGVAKGVRERLGAMDELERILSSRSWRTVDRLKSNPLYRAIATAKYGEGWEKVDPKEDPRAVLARVRNSRSYRFIATAKSTPLVKLIGKGPREGDPFGAERK